MTEEKFIYNIPKTDHPEWWIRFYQHCRDIAWDNNWNADTVANYQLKPYGGRKITTRTQGTYLRFDSESGFTMFLLKWS